MHQGSKKYLGRNSVKIERLGIRVTAPIKRTTFGCRSLFIIRTYTARYNVKNMLSVVYVFTAILLIKSVKTAGKQMRAMRALFDAES